MRRRILWTIGVIVVVAAIAVPVYLARWRDPVGGGGQGGGPGGGPGGPPGRGGSGQPVSVRVSAARKGSIDVTIDALGTVLARNTVVVHVRVDGQLQRIEFQEGHDVAAGAVLAEIDPRPFAAALEQAEGQLARDEALLASARSDLDRYQTLLAQDSIAKQQVDDQLALVHQYQGTVQTDHGNLDNARLQLDWTHVRAPIAGRVGLRQVDVGNMVHAADLNGVVVLTQTRPIYVVFAVPADRAPDIDRRWRAGTELRVEAYDRDGTTRLATGKLESTDNVVDPATSTVKLRAVFDNTDGALFPNQFVNARLTLTTLDDQTLIPAAALQRGTPGTFVYVVGADSTVSLRTIVVGPGSPETISVRGGLQPGERVVTDGTDKLRDKAKVEAAVEAPAAPAAKRGGHGKPGQTPGSPAPGTGRRPRPDQGGAGS